MKPTATPPSTTQAPPWRCNSCCACTSSGAAAATARQCTRRSASSPRASAALGGWPQRFPLRGNDYTEYITFNDDVAGENIEFLLMCQLALGDSRLLGHIHRTMESFLFMQ